MRQQSELGTIVNQMGHRVRAAVGCIQDPSTHRFPIYEEMWDPPLKSKCRASQAP